MEPLKTQQHVAVTCIGISDEDNFSENAEHYRRDLPPELSNQQ